MDMTCRATKRLSCFFIKNNLKNLFKNQFSLLTFWRIYDIIKTQKRRTKHTCWCGGIGRHKGLKIPRRKRHTGSSPVTSTIEVSLWNKLKLSSYRRVFLSGRGIFGCLKRIKDNYMPMWWNWQTRWIQNPLAEMSYGFKSHHRHHNIVADE